MTNLALSLAGQGKNEEALVEARRTASTHPAFSVGRRALSEILYKTGQRQESLEALARACELNPGRKDWRELRATRQNEGNEPRPPEPPTSDRKQ